MAITFVAAGAIVTGANPTVPVPAGYAAGDLLLLVVSSSATPSTPAGWVRYYTQLFGTSRITVLYKTASASESAVALTLTGGTAKSVMVAYRGVNTFDSIATGSSGTGTSLPTNTLVTTVANDFVLSIYGTDATSNASWTIPASTTSRVDSAVTTAFRGLLIVDELQAGAGTSTSRTATLSASNAWSTIAFSLKPVIDNSGSFLQFFY